MPVAEPIIVQAGQLRHRIQIQQELQQQDAVGQLVSIWTSVLSANAAIEYAAGRQAYTPEGFSSQVSHIITMRFNPAAVITPKMRVAFGSRTYVIQYMDDIEMRGRLLRLFVLELNPTT